MGPHLRGPGLPRHVCWSEQQVWGRREAPSSRGLPPCCLGGTTSSWSMKSVGVGWCWLGSVLGYRSCRDGSSCRDGKTRRDRRRRIRRKSRSCRGNGSSLYRLVVETKTTMANTSTIECRFRVFDSMDFILSHTRLVFPLYTASIILWSYSIRFHM